MLNLERSGGQLVGPGSYWNFSTGERVEIDAEQVLPGDGNTTYYRFPPIAMVVIAPFMGLLYAMFLPLIGFTMLIGLVARKLFGEALDGLWKAAAFGWRPSEAYLAGKKKKDAETKSDGNDADNAS